MQKPFGLKVSFLLFGEEKHYTFPNDVEELVKDIKAELPKNYLSFCTLEVQGVPEGLEKYSAYFLKANQHMEEGLQYYQQMQKENPFNFLATLERVFNLAKTNPFGYLAFCTLLSDSSYGERLDDCIANFQYNNFKLANCGKLQNREQEGYILVEDKENDLAVSTNGFLQRNEEEIKEDL